MFHRFAALLAAASLSILLPGCSDEKKETAAPMTYQDSVEASVTAKVKAVNATTRRLTLEDAAGHWMTFTVDDKVKRLNEVMVGDNVKVQYRASLLAELRPPTADESANPVLVTESGQRAGQGSSPSASSTQVTRIVTTVEAVDVPNMLVTLRGPMGDLSVVRGRKSENVKKLKVGDTIVMSYTETVAVSLEKLAAR